ncbi:MAG TPA: hypothetical protein VFL29_08695 [Candidatus Dormibacteraeota bacterium]|nr:hypothetical protein [Candidatus Dormibacteraeota bacterium]
MPRRKRTSGIGIFHNLAAGDYNPVERARRIGANLLRRVTRANTCCGRYGDPGC